MARLMGTTISMSNISPRVHESTKDGNSGLTSASATVHHNSQSQHRTNDIK